jgi:hypothetical protein
VSELDSKMGNADISGHTKAMAQGNIIGKGSYAIIRSPPGPMGEMKSDDEDHFFS